MRAFRLSDQDGGGYASRLGLLSGTLGVALAFLVPAASAAAAK